MIHRQTLRHMLFRFNNNGELHSGSPLTETFHESHLSRLHHLPTLDLPIGTCDTPKIYACIEMTKTDRTRTGHVHMQDRLTVEVREGDIYDLMA